MGVLAVAVCGLRAAVQMAVWLHGFGVFTSVDSKLPVNINVAIQSTAIQAGGDQVFLPLLTVTVLSRSSISVLLTTEQPTRTLERCTNFLNK